MSKMNSYSPRTKLSLPTADEYEFPHNPYAIQQQLMNELFLVLEEKGVGIFESPTGTGKSLTLTCGALCWLEKHEAAVRQDLQARISEVKEQIQRLEAEGAQASDWITTQFETRQQRDELFDLQSLYALLQEQETGLLEMRQRVLEQQKAKQKTSVRLEEGLDITKLKESDQQNHQIEDEWDLIDAAGKATTKAVDKLDVEDNKIYRNVQIFFCSRTHSQLAQVVREVKRTKYGQRIRCVSLASRQQLCVHAQVKKLPNVSLMNERCLDMAAGKVRSKPDAGCKSKTPTLASSCPYKKSQPLQQLSEQALTQVLDIEDLLTIGTRIKACPYYAARAATQQAQLIMLPYQMLLHRSTRLQSGIDLRGAVVIIDEAHNLLDTIAQLHSCELTLSQLLLAQQQLSAYKIKYVTRFSTANLLRINQLLYVLKRLIKVLQSTAADTTRMLRTYELTAEGEFFNIDLYQLLEFCERTRLAQKLQGFCQQQQQQQCLVGDAAAKKPKENTSQSTGSKNTTLALLQHLQQQHVQRTNKRSATPTVDDVAQSKTIAKSDIKSAPTAASMRPLLAFLAALTEAADDGRVLLNTAGSTSNDSNEPPQAYYKYILLNPGSHFQDILRDARALVIAGGTMRPIAELTEQLFHGCPERVRPHFYDHVVPAASVLAFAVNIGPTGRQLCFNYTQRGSSEMLTELIMIIQNVCNVVPAGVICFLPSYDYLATVYAHLQQSTVLRNISVKKRIFVETRSTAAGGQTVEQLLAAYATAINNNEGALLLSVVGGKLSEGLNFADDLGRCVILVGMPYPNRNSPELQERMKYLNVHLGAGAGNEYYENLCMKAVNQCIGRSLRHICDYATVLLLDERYAQERIHRKLPQWIVRSLQQPRNFGVMQSSIAKFFKQKRGGN